MSIIEGYPTGRGRTTTEVARKTRKAVREALAEELARGGQVIALCPRIEDIPKVRDLIRDLAPDARLGTVHGKRRGRRNRAAMADFRAGRTDVLLATTMLETGLDVPNANLMLVFRPDQLGLAQLHQLRGRIGRSVRDARFLLLASRKRTDAEAGRIETLTALSERGDGLRLALADSLARGTGELDGDAQSGHASELGLELFEHLLGVAADGEDPAASVPKVTGEHPWGFGEADSLDMIFSQARDALGRPEDALSAGAYPAVLGAARLLRAPIVAAAPDRFVFTMLDGRTLEVAGTPDALREAATNPKG